MFIHDKQSQYDMMHIGGRIFKVKLHVRDHELDQHDVVSNVVYSSNCQHGEI